MRKLSTGQPSTLGSYLDLTRAAFGAESAATKFIKDKIADSPNGANEEVIADESQMLQMLLQLSAEDPIVNDSKEQK